MKNKKAISLLFLSNIISGFAQGISMIAIPWYFVEVIGRPEVFASAYLIITFVTLFWGLYAGALIDRYSRKKLFILINLVCGIIVGGVAISGYLTNTTNDLLVILVFAITIFNYNVHYPNLYAFGQEITEKKHYGKLNSYIEIQGQSTSILAGAFAALLLTGTINKTMNLGGFIITFPFDIHPWKIHEIFLMDAITYMIVILIFMQIKYSRIVTDKIEMGTLFSRLKSGILYLKKNSLIFHFGLSSYMLFAFLLVEIHILLPTYVHDFLEGKGDIYASAEVYYSLGAILAGVFVIRFFRKKNSIFGIILLMLIVSFAFVGMAFIKSLWYFFIANLILGLTNAGVRILRTTYLFNHIPNNIIGRTNSVFNSLNIMVRMCLIGLFAMPYFLTNDNVRWGYLVGAVMIILAIVPLLLHYKSLINLEKLESN
ncbi:MAG: MFS transporter [Flavobacteriales bacterium]|nr:MFS transporter [Flavobacteriales bacterium]